jgi:hypothetical protein
MKITESNGKIKIDTHYHPESVSRLLPFTDVCRLLSSRIRPLKRLSGG